MALDALLVARPVEHDGHHVVDVDLLALGDQLDRLAERAVEVEQVGDRLAAGHLLHVDARPRVEHRAALGQRDHRRRSSACRARTGACPRAGRRRCRPRGGCAVADVLAVVQHRRLVLLALADHDDAVHADGPQHVVHAVDGGLVGGVLVAAADPARGLHGGGLGHAHELEREVAVREDGAHRTPGGLRLRSDSDERGWRRRRRSPAAPASAVYQPQSSSIWPDGSPGRSMMPM